MASDNHQLPPEIEQALAEGPGSAVGVRDAWKALGSIEEPRPVTPTTEEAWADLQARLESRRSGMRASDRPARPTRHLRRALVYGGVCVLLVALGLWWQRPVTVLVAAGDQDQVELPDGSIVELNSDSRLSYRRGFRSLPIVGDDARRVHLEGEAFFVVSRDLDRPFVVETRDGRVEVLGTQFNVRSREIESGARTVVTLQEGVVRVYAEGIPAEPVLLDSVGASIVIRPGDVPKALLDAPSLDHVLAWRTNGFAAVNEPVGEILREIQRRFSIALEVDGRLPLESAMTVLYPRGTSAEDIIHDLCLSRGWNYRETSRGFQVFSEDGARGSDTVME